MATGTIQKPVLMQYVDDDFGNITLSSQGFYPLTTSVPNSGHPVSINVKSWSSTGGKPISVSIYDGGGQPNKAYVFGEAGQQITGLKTRTWYF